MSNLARAYVKANKDSLPSKGTVQFAEFIMDNNYTSKIVRLGIPDRIVEHGEQLELHAECGFDPDSIVKEVKKLTNKKLEKIVS